MTSGRRSLLLVLLLTLFSLGYTSYPSFISSEELNDVQVGYQLSSFTNLRSKSKYVDIVLVADDHLSLATQSFSLNNGSFYATNGYKYSFEYNSNLTGYSVVGTLGADFNNDKFSDLMVVFAAIDSTYKLAILWNRDDRFSSYTLISNTFTSPPSLLDYNGDIYPDFICSEGGSRYFYVNNNLSPGTFRNISIPENDAFPVNTRSTKVAFGDLNGDCQADLFAITELANKSASIFEYWQANRTSLTRLWQRVIPDVAKSDSYSAPVITDMDSNGKLDIVVAGCSELTAGWCQESKLYTFYNDPCIHSDNDDCSLVTIACAPYGFTLSETVNVFEKFVTTDKETWGFLGLNAGDMFSSNYLIRPADIDSDGHVDLLTVLKYDNSQVPVILYNIADTSVSGGRTFHAEWMDELELPESLSNFSPWVLASADVLGKGQSQLFVVGREGDKFALGYFTLKEQLDTYFLKITVLCPGCLDEGVTIIGACTYYETSGLNGGTEVGYGAQNALLSIGSLQTPYTLYGLGKQANYIEEIVSAYRVRENVNKFGFDSLIPNSQVFAIPYENDGKWKLVMLVIPGSALWSTLIVLGACSLVCIVIIAGLHIKEKKEDDREKRKFNAKFNFDAM